MHQNYAQYVEMIVLISNSGNLIYAQYKIEIKLRNHNVLDRQEVIDEVLKYVPPNHIIRLDNPQIVILVEIFKVINYCSVLLTRSQLSVLSARVLAALGASVQSTDIRICDR